MCVVEVVYLDSKSRYTFKGWREAYDFVDRLNEFSNVRIYKI